MSHPRLSVDDIAVIVAFKNESRFLKECATTLLEATRGTQAELIFVDDASNDGSAAQLQSLGDRIRLLGSDGSGPGKARNLASQSTQKNFLAFLDADCRVPSTWLHDLVRGFRQVTDSPALESTVSSVGGRQEVYRDASERERWNAAFLSSLGFVSDYLHSEQGVSRVLHNPTCNVLYRRDALRSVGGFDENFWPCEDLDLDLRLSRQGWQAWYDPRVWVEHKRPDTFAGLMRMMARYGFGHAKLVQKHGLCQKLHALPGVAAAWMLVIPLFANRAPLWLTVLWVFLPALGLLALLWVKFKRISKTIGAFPYTVAIIVAWLVGFFNGSVRSKKIAEHRE